MRCYNNPFVGYKEMEQTTFYSNIAFSFNFKLILLIPEKYSNNLTSIIKSKNKQIIHYELISEAGLF